MKDLRLMGWNGIYGCMSYEEYLSKEEKRNIYNTLEKYKEKYKETYPDRHYYVLDKSKLDSESIKEYMFLD